VTDLISIGRSGIMAYRDALAGVSENVVNANTDGFAKRQVTLKEQTSNSGPMFLYRNTTSFNGVQATEVSRVWDQYRAANAWSAGSDAAMADTRAQWLGTIEQTLDDSDAGVGVKLSRIFTSATQLGSNPTDTTLRQSFLYAVSEGAAAITRAEANFAKIGVTVVNQAKAAVNDVNEATVALGRVNVALHAAPPGTSGRAALEDQRDSLIGKIADTVGVDVTLDTYGAVEMRLQGNGTMLLASDSNLPAQLSAVAATDGQLSFLVTEEGAQTAVAIATGKLAAFADISTLIADRRRQFDTLAADLADGLNDWQDQGRDLNDDPGARILDGTTAATLAMRPITTDQVAAADAGSANGNLVALQALRGTTGVEAQWRGIVTDQSLRVASAEAQRETATARKDSAYTQLDTVSGVDLDAEAANLMRFQQAYSASAKIIQTARETLQSILQLF
jgi:flagellar hook-associated protein 1